jgi:hypothetical protein
MAVKMSAARGEIPGDLDLLSDQHLDGAGEISFGFR